MIGLIKGTMRQAKEVSGLPLPIASYKSNLKAPIRSLKVAINATQSGSGEPSPDNIRPISGVSECNVVRCGKNILKTNGLTFANPSSTATANTTPRTWSRDSYCAGISHNNYYNTAPIDGYSVSDNEIVVKSKNAAYGVNIPITLARGISGKITLNANVTGGNINVGFYKEDGTFILSNESSTLPRTVNIPANTFWAVLGFVPTISQNPSVEISFTDIMIELSDTSSSYEAYTGNTYNKQLGDTYFGCSLNWTTGLLTIDRVKTLLKDLPNRWIKLQSGTGAFYIERSLLPYAIDYNNRDNTKSNTYSYSKSGSQSNYSIRISDALYIVDDRWADVTEWQDYIDNNDVYIVYPLATPITVQLTPTQVEQLLINNVWADTGDVEELKYTDRQVYYGR